MNDVTAMICNRDEHTFEKSILSIEPHVKKIVVSDASKHAYPNVKKICEALGEKVSLHRMDPHYGDQANFLYTLVETKWALRWDADFVAKDNIETLFKFAMNQSWIKWDWPNIAIRFGVLDPIKNISHKEHYLFTVSDDLMKLHWKKIRRYLIAKLKGKRIPRLKWHPFPKNYCLIDLPLDFAFHYRDIPEWRKIEHRFQADWGCLSKKARGNMSFEEYVKRRLENADRK